MHWLNHRISGSNLTLSGAPEITDRVTLVISAQTPFGYHATTPFVLSINPNSHPQLKKPIPSQTAPVGIPFDFPLPKDTFEDSNKDTLGYNAILADGSLFPSWLTFSQEQDGLWHFKGTPGGWDTNPFSSKVMTIQITAHDTDNARAIALFNLAVAGTSTIGLILKSVDPFCLF